MTTDNPDPLEVWREACLAKSILNNHDENEHAAAAIIAQHYAPVIAENERLREQNASLKHWSVGHIDALLLYAAGSYPNDSHVKDAVKFCRIVAPDRKLRMDPLEASSFHPAEQALGAKP